MFLLVEIVKMSPVANKKRKANELETGKRTIIEQPTVKARKGETGRKYKGVQNQHVHFETVFLKFTHFFPFIC